MKKANLKFQVGRSLEISKNFQTTYNCLELLVDKLVETYLASRKKKVINSNVEKLVAVVSFVREKVLKGTSNYSATRCFLFFKHSVFNEMGSNHSKRDNSY